MTTATYSINQAVYDCIQQLKNGTDRSPTTIRCTINDLLDSAEKNGCRVRHEYDHERAIKRVRDSLTVLDAHA